MSISSGFHPLNNMSEDYSGFSNLNEWLNAHVNVVAVNEYDFPVNIDALWPNIPEGVQIERVWYPWNDPGGQYSDFRPERMNDYIDDVMRWRDLYPDPESEESVDFDEGISVGSQESRV